MGDIKGRPWKLSEYLGVDNTWPITVITEEEYNAGVDKPEGPHFLAIDVYVGQKDRQPRTGYYRLDPPAPQYEVGALYYVKRFDGNTVVLKRVERGWSYTGQNVDTPDPALGLTVLGKVPLLPELTDEEFDAIDREYPEGAAAAPDSAYVDFDIIFDRIVQAYRAARQ